MRSGLSTLAVEFLHGMDAQVSLRRQRVDRSAIESRGARQSAVPVVVWARFSLPDGLRTNALNQGASAYRLTASYSRHAC